MKAVPAFCSWLFCISFFAVGLTPLGTSAADCELIVATAVSVQGRVEVHRVKFTQWQPVILNDIFCAGDRIRVGDRSRADVALANRAVLRLGENTPSPWEEFKKSRPFWSTSSKVPPIISSVPLACWRYPSHSSMQMWREGKH